VCAGIDVGAADGVAGCGGGGGGVACVDADVGVVAAVADGIVADGVGVGGVGVGGVVAVGGVYADIVVGIGMCVFFVGSVVFGYCWCWRWCRRWCQYWCVCWC